MLKVLRLMSATFDGMRLFVLRKLYATISLMFKELVAYLDDRDRLNKIPLETERVDRLVVTSERSSSLTGDSLRS